MSTGRIERAGGAVRQGIRTPESSTAFSAAYRSLLGARGEDDVRDALHDLLKALGAGRFSLEYPLATGRVDMASEEKRVLIETKARGAVGPTRPGAASEETQKDQAERYLRDATDRWLGDLLLHGSAHGTPRVFLTDGVKWWGYELGPKNRLSAIARGFAASSEQELAAFLKQHVVPADRRYKPPVPDDLISELLLDFASDLEVIYRRHEGNAGVGTKFTLWKECLRGAGIVPPEDEPVGQASLFVRHTVLVVAARTLKILLREPGSAGQAAIDEVADGFPAWLAEFEGGRNVLGRIATRLDEYQWRGSAGDRLKEAYHKLIAAEERKEFGEYYTPDWLAEKVVEEVLDEDWMDAAVTAASAKTSRGGTPPSLDGLTVLDPACGSGMFLFHAARRLHRHIHSSGTRERRRMRATSSQRWSSASTSTRWQWKWRRPLWRPRCRL